MSRNAFRNSYFSHNNTSRKNNRILMYVWKFTLYGKINAVKVGNAQVQDGPL